MEFLNKILIGDAREQLKNLPDKCVNTCVTSPPYYGLRDYGTATWVGGDASCDHHPATTENKRGIASSTLGDGKKHTGHNQEGFKSRCARCGAIRVDRQIGLEETPEEYVATLVDLFTEVWRVLKDDGTLWLNLGDSYASLAGGYDATGSRGGSATISKNTQAAVLSGKTRRPYAGIKQKDLIGIPWMVAFALRAAGWYLRQDIIWHKPNPMPESVTDRCTKSHEYIFLFSKKQKYYYDAAAIKEESAYVKDDRSAADKRKRAPTKQVNGMRHAGSYEMANKRSVWTVPLCSFTEAHFATYPPNLIAPCILAGCPEEGVVLDLFFGAGTTGVVAKKLHRNFIGIELNPKYASMAEKRLGKELGMFRWNKEVNVERSVATDVK